MRQETRFTRESIDPDYAGGVEEFDYICEYLISQNLPVRNIPPALASYLFRVEKFYWRANQIALVANKGGGVVDGPQITHEGIHLLMYRYFDQGLEGIPLFTLFSETVATCSNFFFHLSARRVGTSGYRGDLMLSRYLENATEFCGDQERASARVLGLIQEAIQDPYQAFKQAVLEMFEVYRMFWRINKEHSDFDLDRIRKQFENIGSMKYSPTFYHIDFPGHTYFAINHCGLVSDKRDQECIDRTLELMNRSRSFMEFMKKLAAGAKHANPRTKRTAA